MDAFKTSLRVVLAHIRQVKIKIVEGGGVALRNFNTLCGGGKEKEWGALRFYYNYNMTLSWSKQCNESSSSLS